MFGPNRSMTSVRIVASETAAAPLTEMVVTSRIGVSDHCKTTP